MNGIVSKIGWAPRLRSVLLMINLTVLILPLGSIVFLQIYENEVVRQKEAALLAQGAYVSTIFRRELLVQIGVLENDTLDLGKLKNYGLPVFSKRPALLFGELGPSVDLLRDVLRSPLSQVRHAVLAPEPSAFAAGRELNPILFRAQTMTLDTVRVVDVFGNVVASTQGEEGRAVPHWEEVQRALQGQATSFVRKRVPDPVIRNPLDALGLRPDLLVSVALPIIEQDRVLGAVVLTGIPSRVSEVLYGNRGTIGFALAILLIVAVILALLTSQTITEPIQTLIRYSRQLAAGDYNVDSSGRSPFLYEVRVLRGAFIRMSEKIRERSEYITGFARGVSHEFKTPLTSIRGSVELLLEHGDSMSPDRRIRFLKNLEEDADRLDRLTGRLLDLAKADATLPGSTRNDLSSAIHSGITRFEKQLQFEEVSVKSSVVGSIDETDMEIMVTNLFENIKQHCPENTTVKVEFYQVGDNLHLIVKDSGGGISDANLRRVLDPFFTTARNRGGTGLGLSIVKSLVDVYHGQMSISTWRDDQETGTLVQITLPLVRDRDD